MSFYKFLLKFLQIQLFSKNCRALKFIEISLRTIFSFLLRSFWKNSFFPLSNLEKEVCLLKCYLANSAHLTLNKKCSNFAASSNSLSSFNQYSQNWKWWFLNSDWFASSFKLTLTALFVHILSSFDLKCSEYFSECFSQWITCQTSSRHSVIFFSR